MREGRVYLAGGGCGAADLVTVKTRNVLQCCDTVVYDSLVPEDLLQWTKPDCEKIYVGKRYGSHAMKQDEINALLAAKAREGKIVVRLKGGDPYVFGRGGEEFIALREAGIYCEEIPGITSAIAVPAAAGIPVTHRGISDSVTVVTGTAADKGGQAELKMDFHALAQLAGTLVILMGMHHLPEIVAGLLAAGKDRHTPCAIIMEGTTGRQRVLRAVLFELPARAAKQGFTSPAVILIGAVAKLELVMKEGIGDDRKQEGTGTEHTERNRAEAKHAETNRTEAEHTETDRIEAEHTEIDKTESDPTGTNGTEMQKIAGVIGTQRFVDKMASVLRARGVRVCDMCFMKVRPTQESLPDFTEYGWLVFTSPNGVRVFLEKMRQEKRDLRLLYHQKIAVIGPGTAALLQEAGIYADYMPAVYDTMHLAQGLSDIIMEGGKGEGRGKETQEESPLLRSVISLRAQQGSDTLSEFFRQKGIPYAEYALYALEVQEKKRDAVIAEEPDYIVFGSAMGARAYFEGLAKNHLQNTRSRYVCIGAWCAKEVQKYCEIPPLIAEEASVDAVAACLFSNRKLL